MRRNHQPTPRTPNASSAFRFPTSAFTLVELLVVIAIIGILAGLLIVAAQRAIVAGKRAQIRAEVTQFATAIEDYKNSFGSYPPNAQTDEAGTAGNNGHLDEAVILANFKRHFSKAFPNSREKQSLIGALVGQDLRTGSDNDPALQILPGGMNAAEAMVFWLSGFSDDPKFPISGPGGPAYSIDNGSGSEINGPNQADPIDNRSWRLGINVAQLGPRALEVNERQRELTGESIEGSFFPDGYERYITYTNPRTNKLNRINFWYLRSPDSESPYAYFDASRGSGATTGNDAPAATSPGLASYDGNPAMAALVNLYAIKARQSSSTATNPFTYANDGKFQILHGGTDGTWGSFARIDPSDATNSRLIDAATSALNPPTFPEGPWTLELADTMTNLGDGTLEDEQP